MLLLKSYFTSIEVPKYPDADAPEVAANPGDDEHYKRVNAQHRMCAYRSLIFWTYPDIRKKERHPLPACIYRLIRDKFPITQGEEPCDDLQYTVYMPEPQDE